MDNTKLLQFGPFPLRIMIGITFLAHCVPSLADFGHVQGFIGGFKVDMLLLLMAVSLLITGPGRISIERDVLKTEIWPRGRSLVPQKVSGRSG